MGSFTGLVQRVPFARGSKSERTAVVLRTADGDLVLRRRGGSAYQDPKLGALVGRQVTFDGVLHGGTLIVTRWSIDADE